MVINRGDSERRGRRRERRMKERLKEEPCRIQDRNDTHSDWQWICWVVDSD
jgi:hypothetical protein